MISIKTGNRRLLKLAKFLRTEVPKARFNYGTWWDGLEEHDDDTGAVTKKRKPGSCGTQGCALGWAAVMPEFNKLGLAIPRTPEGGFLRTVPVFTGKNGVQHTGFNAAQKLFGLSDADAAFLFSPQNDREEGGATPAEVADKITEFVKARRARAARKNRA